ncbi:MAG TPA: hypothetical protein VFX45_11890 [Solirubrobacterales bacterium]|nr:hypothetical protein [Solirubrobacterales bacterium]
MEPVTPRPFELDRIFPDPEAEPILTVTFLLELPHCIRVADAKFLISDWGDGWPGWSPDAMGYMADVAPLPEGVEPRYRIALNQARVEGRTPLRAAELAFPDWEGAASYSDQGETEAERSHELRSSALVSIYARALETPFGNEDEHEVVEWLSRRFDEALALLNQYLVILAAMNDEWHISSISRIDLPRLAPWKLNIQPAADGWVGPSGTLDAHATLRDDLPDIRSQEELMAAVEIIHEYRAGRVPFFDWIELYQSSEHHLGSGRNAQSVIAASTATEVLINTLFRVLWEAKDLDHEKLAGVLDCGFKNQLVSHLPKFLDQELALDDEKSPAGIWHRDCYLLRNRIVHKGHKPTSGEAYDSKIATGEFARLIGAALEDDPRIADVKSFLRARPPSKSG